MVAMICCGPVRRDHVRRHVTTPRLLRGVLLLLVDADIVDHQMLHVLQVSELAIALHLLLGGGILDRHEGLGAIRSHDLLRHLLSVV